jgi:hypothetical protein
MQPKATFRPLNRDEIIDIVRAALPRAVRSYERLSRDTPHGVPEAWIGAAIAEDLHRQGGFYIVPEKRLDSPDLGIDSESRGKLDLVVHDPGTYPDDAKIRCIIEVKGAKTTWGSFRSDANRIRDVLASASGKIEFGLVVYASGEMASAQIEDAMRETSKRTGVEQTKLIKVGPYRGMRTDSAGSWFGVIVPIEMPQSDISGKPAPA